MMSAKMATPGLLKIKVFWNKGYYVVDVVMWPKFGNSSTLAFLQEKLS